MVKTKNPHILRLLLGVFTVQILLPLFISFSIQVVRKYQKERIENYELTHHLFEIIEFSNAAFIKLDIVNNEFTYKNNLYDIKAIVKLKNKVKLTVINDVKEKQLKLVRTEIEKHSAKNALQLLKYSQLEFTGFEKTIDLDLYHYFSKVNYNLLKEITPDNPYLKILTPPPDAV